jgi:hypothetical protein
MARFARFLSGALAAATVVALAVAAAGQARQR